MLDQANQRPSWQLQDVYKLAFQAALGSEHAAPGEAAARRWLEQEIATLGAAPLNLPLSQSRPDGRLVRVNLRPYLAAGGNLDALLAAFLRTAARWQGKRETLQRYIDWAVELTEAGELAFSPAEAADLFPAPGGGRLPGCPSQRDLPRALPPSLPGSVAGLIIPCTPDLPLSPQIQFV